MFWQKIAKTFGQWPRDITNPVTLLKKYKEKQEELGRSGEQFSQAIEEIYEALGLSLAGDSQK